MPGARPCARRQLRGARAGRDRAESNGAVANVDAIASGDLESGFAQSDVAYWAYTGTGIYADQARSESAGDREFVPGKRHVVARMGSGIKSVRDLGRACRWTSPAPTLVDARIILDAFGVREDDLTASYLSRIRPAP
jgi:TRAP-type uncharacterized transport system substrate-binding protein